MKSEKRLKLFLIFLITITLLYIIFLINQNNNKTSKTIPIEDVFSIKEENLNHCKIENDENCKYNNNTYKYITLKKTYKNLQPVITSLNQIITQKKEKTIKSDLNSSDCNTVKNTYIYRELNILDEYFYTSNNIIGIAYKFNSLDICTNKKEKPLFNSYIYDTKKDKILTNDEILKLYHIKEEDIEQSITNNISYWNQASSTNYTIQDINKNYKLYLSQEGKIGVFYTLQKENTTYIALVSN